MLSLQPPTVHTPFLLLLILLTLLPHSAKLVNPRYLWLFSLILGLFWFISFLLYRQNNKYIIIWRKCIVSICSIILNIFYSLEIFLCILLYTSLQKIKAHPILSSLIKKDQRAIIGILSSLKFIYFCSIWWRLTGISMGKQVEVEALTIQGPKLLTVKNQVKKLGVSVLVVGQRRQSPLLTLWWVFMNSSFENDTFLQLHLTLTFHGWVCSLGGSRQNDEFVEQCIKTIDRHCLTIGVRRQINGLGGYLITTRWLNNFWLLA